MRFSVLILLISVATATFAKTQRKILDEKILDSIFNNDPDLIGKLKVYPICHVKTTYNSTLKDKTKHSQKVVRTLSKKSLELVLKKKTEGRIISFVPRGGKHGNYAEIYVSFSSITVNRLIFIYPGGYT